MLIFGKETLKVVFPFFDENVILPAEKDGRVYCIQNAGATNALDVQNDQAVRQVLLGPGDVAVLVSSDTQWYLFLNSTNL